MRAPLPKVALEAQGVPLIVRVLRTAQKLDPEQITVVTGHQSELVERLVSENLASYPEAKINFAFQKEQLGTGHAVMCGLPQLGDFSGTVLVLYGDVPLINHATLLDLIETHRREEASVTVLSLWTDQENGYGRIQRDRSTGQITKIVEKRDCGPTHQCTNEFNSGLYCVESGFLRTALDELSNDNAQGEYYFTDVIEIAAKKELKVAWAITRDLEEVQGVNAPTDLLAVNRSLYRRKAEALLAEGVEVADLDTTFIEESVEVAPGTKIGPGVQIRGATKALGACRIDGPAVITDCEIAADVHIKPFSVCEGASIGSSSAIGPFAHLRPGTSIGSDAKVGNFVETKKAKLADGVKASHLSYLGDCDIGSESNIGAGTITCNYDGYQKSKTTMGSGVFIGSNTALVAPVTVGDRAVIGAGSVITKDVKPDSLALTRAPQNEVAGWAERKRAIASKKEKQ